MPTYEFTVTLDRAPVDDDYDRLYEAGLDDALPGTRGGTGVLDVARVADSITAAIATVVHDVTRAGFHVVGIEDDDLVSLKGLAERAGRTHESLRLLAAGKRGPGGFPRPVAATGPALYSWAAVSDWLVTHYGPDSVAVATEDQRTLTAAGLILRAFETAGPGRSAQLSVLAQSLNSDFAR